MSCCPPPFSLAFVVLVACLSIVRLRSFYNLPKQTSCSVLSVWQSVSTRGRSVATEVVRKKTKRDVIILWRFYSGEQLITIYYRACKVLLIFETPEIKFFCHFTDANIPERVGVLRRVVVVVVNASLVSCVSKTCMTLSRYTYGRPNYRCAYLFICFSFSRIFPNDCFKDSGTSNDASLTLFVIHSYSTCSLTLTLLSIWTICDTLQI